MKSKLTLIAFMLMIITSGFSQCFYYFSGQVTNANGAPIAGAQVTIDGVNSGNVSVWSDVATTDSNGNYTFCSPTGSNPGASIIVWQITASSCGQSQTASITSTPNNTQGWQYSQNFQLNCTTLGCGSQITYTYTGQSYIIFNLTSSFAGSPSSVSWNINGNAGQGSGGYYTYLLNPNESTLNVCATATYASGCVDSICTTFNINLGCYYTFSGYVLDANGNAMANQAVSISGGANGAVAYTANTTSNANGFYSFCFPSITGGSYTWTLNTNACGTNTFATVNTTPNNPAGSTFNTNLNTNCNTTGCPTVITYIDNNNGTITFMAGSSGLTAQQSIWTVNGVTYNGSPNQPASIIYQINPNDSLLNVCAVVSYTNGCTSTACTNVTVSNNGGNNNCEISIIVTSGGLLNNSINYSSQVVSGGNAQVVWSFGNVGTASGSSGVFTFPAAGTYVVCAYAYFASGCADTVCTTVTISSNPSCNAVAQANITTAPNVIQYSGAGSTGSANIQYSWNFGDGTTSTSMNGTHTFPGPGTYQVCLTITDGNCTDTDCINITVGNNTGNGTICGCVNMATPAGTYLAPDCGVAYLVQYNSTNNTLNAVQTATLTPNGYCFTNVPSGAYTVKVALCSTSQYYQSFMPTYFGNVLYWFQANQIIVNGNYVNPGTCINMIPGNNPGGPGFVGGSIFQGANKAQVGDPIPDVSVLLLNLSDGAITHTVTDANGAYSFANLAYGTYKIFPEQPGVNTYPIYVTISADEPTATDLNFGLNTGGFVGVEENTLFTSNSGIFPNPASESVNIEINSKVAAEATFHVIDLQGRTISSINRPLVKGPQQILLNTNELSNGFYFVKVTVGTFSKEFKMIIKH